MRMLLFLVILEAPNLFLKCIKDPQTLKTQHKPDLHKTCRSLGSSVVLCCGLCFVATLGEFAQDH